MPDVISGEGKLSVAAVRRVRGAAWEMSSEDSGAHVGRTFWTVVRISPFSLSEMKIFGRFRAESDLIRLIF